MFQKIIDYRKFEKLFRLVLLRVAMLNFENLFPHWGVFIDQNTFIIQNI